MQTFSFRRLSQILLGGLSISLHAAGDVNLKNASFVKTWTDLPEFKRTYNSRSLHRGLLGLGWCTEFEKSLDLSQPHQVRLEDCGNDVDIVYKSAGSNAPLFVAENGEKILKTGGVYVRHLAHHGTQIFNAQGRLISLRLASLRPKVNKDGRIISLGYDERGLLRKISFEQKYLLRIFYDPPPSRHISRIESSQNKESYYFYYKDNLAEVRNAWKSKYQFTYDELQNLTRIDYPDKSQEKITYDPDKDWVLSYQDRKNCQENYRYSENVNGSSTQLVRACPQQAPREARIEFRYKNENNKTYLALVRIFRGVLWTEISYNPITGESRTTQSLGKLVRHRTLGASNN